MATNIDIAEASVYVGTYHKYNAGSIFGAWLELSDYPDKESFYKACAEIHKDEQDPEFMFQDYENIPESLIGESWISENFFAIREALNTLNESELEPFFIWCDNGHRDLSKEDALELISSFQEDFVGEFKSDKDFAIQYIDEIYDLSDFVKTYFDYEAFARDLFCGDYWSDSGYVFHIS